jgi:hypothetical protein
MNFIATNFPLKGMKHQLKTGGGIRMNLSGVYAEKRTQIFFSTAKHIRETQRPDWPEDRLMLETKSA